MNDVNDIIRERGRYHQQPVGNQWEEIVDKAAVEGVNAKITAIAVSLSRELQEGRITLDDFLDRMHRARGARRAIRRRLLSKNPNQTWDGTFTDGREP